MRLERIISGGQTGVDRGALNAAISRGFPCGGSCPRGRKAEDGVIPPEYPVTEVEGGYRRRTRQNVLDSDGTAIIHFGTMEGGTEQTLLYCSSHHKPCKLIDATRLPAEQAAIVLLRFVAENGIRVLNVAGPRLSRQPLASAYAEEVIGLVLDGVSKRPHTSWQDSMDA